MAMRRFYCSEVVDKETNKVEYHFKEAKKKKYITFQTQREAVRHVKEMKIDAMVWFRQHGQFVSSFKTLKDINYEKTDDIEIVHVKPKELKSITKAEEAYETSGFNEADNMFLTKEENKMVKVEKTKAKPVEVENPVLESINKERAIYQGFFETPKQENAFWLGASVLLVLFVILIVLVILAIFLNLA